MDWSEEVELLKVAWQSSSVYLWQRRDSSSKDLMK